MFKASLKLPADLSDEMIALIGQAIGQDRLAHTALRAGNKHTGPWVLDWFFDKEPERKTLQAELSIALALQALDIPVKNTDWSIEPVPETNWLEESYRAFPPFTVGPFFIHGAHYDAAVPDGLMGLQIDAATAFGSGEHGTTKGCLQAMLDLKGKGVCPWNILDMGTGSGILAIAAWKLWKAPVLAVDNDPESIAVTQRHMQSNAVSGQSGGLSTLVNEGFEGQSVTEKGLYELIIANILAGPLKDMAKDLIQTLDDNGYVILSGMLNEQAPDVQKTYESLGLKCRKQYDLGEWSTLVLQKP
ncbi:MAG: 50S ribosomal protein L11 methyltransferase [Alphaproteobacteria bacterium]|nr:50S ribosomal protein L11 methyltransferase [Alphaproteobacteria bacterium]